MYGITQGVRQGLSICIPTNYKLSYQLFIYHLLYGFTPHYIKCYALENNIPHNIIVLLCKGTYILDKLHPVDQLRTVLEWCRGVVGEAVDGFCRLFKVSMQMPSMQ